MRIKIMYLVSTLRTTGPTNQLYNLVTNLEPSKFKPIIITLSPEPSDTSIEKFNKRDIKIVSLELSRLEGAIKAHKKLNDIFTKYKPDIIHSQGLRPDDLVNKIMKRKKITTFLTIRNFPFDDYQMRYGRVLGLLMARKHLKIIKDAPKPIACSYSLKKRFEEELKIKTHYIQNGVDTENYYPLLNNEKKLMREKLGMPLNKKIYISVGSIITRKSPKDLINSFINFKEKDALLYIIGEGPLLEECRKTANNSENIIFTGSISNVNEYLQASDIFISASKSEGLPNTVLEALAVGLPVCLSNIKPHEEFFQFDETIGVLFETGSVKSMTLALKKINEKNYEKMSVAALKVINNKLSAKLMAEKYSALYIDAIKDTK